MKNSIKLIALLFALVIGTSGVWGQTSPYTYDFNSPTDTSAWTYTLSSSTYVSYTIASSHQGITSTGSSDSFFAMSFVNKSGHSLEMVSKTSYNGISNITFDACSTDNSKPNFSLSIIDGNGNETTILQNATTKDTLGSTGTKKWARGYSKSVNNLSGKIKFRMYSSSSGKYAALDNIVVTFGGSTPPTPPTPSGPSNDATLSDLQVGGATIAGFASNVDTYSYTVPAGTTTVPTVTATTSHDSATVVITDATSIPGATTVTVTAADSTTTKTYTINFVEQGATPPTPPVPSTSLTIHETEIYESSPIAGGYGGTLAVYNNREYEVYYINRDASGSNLSISLVNTDKNNGITTGTSNVQCAANDGWLVVKGKSNSSASDNVGNEFGSMVRRLDIQTGDSIVMHIKGYSEFAMVAADKKKDTSSGQTKPDDNRYFEVYVDGQLQASQFNTNTTIRRYPITTGEHVIKIIHKGTEQSKFFAFSLQVAYVPKLKYVSGNDSTQIVYQTDNIRPITYYLKNRINDAELRWDGAEATGISLVKGANDTLYLQGTANCPNGTYSYTISAKDGSGAVVSSLNGSFQVNSKVECTNSGLLNIRLYEQTAMTPVVFRCYTLDMNSVQYQWGNNTPAPGLSFSVDAANHTVTLSGTPTTPGTYTYTVSLIGGNSIEGSVTVRSNSPTIINPSFKTLLYLYKDNDAGVFTYIQSSRKYNYFARPAAEAMGKESDYALYDAIIISEDVDATNAEALNIIRTLRKPVLNMKIFTYSTNRLGWGDPNNGSISNKEMTILQPSHAIFSGLSSTTKVELISEVMGNKGLMPAEVNYAGTICLATAPLRGENYTDDGAPQTFIHEVPATVRGTKYITLPIGTASADKLTADGKKLFDNIIGYLTSTATSPVTAPTIAITAFSINNVAGTIDPWSHSISVTLPKGTDVTALSPIVTLADPKLTYVTPGSGETIDFSDTHYGVVYTVSDYITKVQYTVRVNIPSDLESADSEGLLFSNGILHNPQGIWVNIFSVSGQLITTTNSHFSFEGLAHGVYVVRSQNSMLKVMH